MDDNIKALFNPENVAVVGASKNPLKAGYVILKNMIDIGYSGKIFPVNVSEDEVLGLSCVKKLSDIKDKVELVVLIMPSRMVYEVMADLELRMKDKNDVKVIVCAAADYGETKTEEGIKRQKCLMDTASRYGIRVVGPNCIGVIDNLNRVDTTFVETGVDRSLFGDISGISFISQSGSVAASLLMISASQPVPISFNKFISIGNMADIDFVDLLEYFENDKGTRVIGMYLEGYPDGRRLIEALKRITPKKPVVVLKVGRSDKGASAANSHTGSLAGADSVYDAAFRQYGVIRVDTIEELLDTVQAFDRLKLPENHSAFILTQAGGPGIYCTDELSKHENLYMPVVNEETKNMLRKVTPPMSAVCSPEGYTDITASAGVAHHVDALKAVMDDENVGSVLFVTVTPTFLPRVELAEAIVKLLKDEGYQHKKPVFICIMAGSYVLECRRIIENSGLYTFEFPDRAVKALSNMVKYADYVKKSEREA